MYYKKMVKGLPLLKTPTKVCSDCLVGKQHRDSIPKKSFWRATQKLQLVHADICGPVKPESNSRKRYMITFIDDFSRRCWVYFLSEKSEAFVAFKKFKNYAEKESGSLVCCLRTDRGGEFTSNEFNDFCSSNGIKRQLTASYTPQQNGVAERKNRTIMNLVRSMLSEKKIPKEFWPEAVNWCVHVLNRSPTLAVKDHTPEEAWSGIKPTVEYFQVFGCISHVHIPDSRRTKLDDKSTKCVLLGVSEETKAYRLYNPITKKIVVSRDVVFEEDEKWDWGNSGAEVKDDVLDWGDVDEIVESNMHSESEEENEEHVQTDAEHVVSSSSSNSLERDEPSPLEARNRRAPFWMDDYETGDGLSETEEMHNLVLYTYAGDPCSFEDAVRSLKWREAMDREISSIEKNGTWELTDLPKGAKKIGVKWVFKTKLNERGEVDKYKARLVAKGYAK